MDEVNCQVEERLEKWPYAEKCAFRADFEMLPVAENHPLKAGWPGLGKIDEPLPMCEMHAQLASAQWPEVIMIDLRLKRQKELLEAQDDRES